MNETGPAWPQSYPFVLYGVKASGEIYYIDAWHLEPDDERLVRRCLSEDRAGSFALIKLPTGAILRSFELESVPAIRNFS